MRVVALVSGGIGDQILFFPTIDDIKRYYPNAQIDVVTEPRSKAAYRVSKSVSEVITFDFSDRNSLADWGNLVGTMRDREYDVAITFGQSWLIGLILWLTGIPTRIGFQGKGSGFLTHPIPLNKQQYAACMYHDLLKGMGINSLCPELTVNVPKSDIEWATNEQKRLGIKDSGYVLIYVTSQQSAQIRGTNNIYPIENWVHIIQDFQHKQPEMPIVVVAEPNDEVFIRSIKESIPNIKVMLAENIGKLTSMIAGANLMLSTENAPIHLSVAVQTYTIVLFGSTEPTTLLPQSDKFLAIKSPTGRLADIPATTVLEKVWGG
ncbi:glycosyltransferase family 9 protein [Calothrix sp. UHCC 0171]|uniref:glycosyltransferase family 9 protein n=1 Tax=Calothrix sp. UHCC 0171 TaxID=3110245 RepID=UPI002B210A89|nr:glycosyltransferase family 9 protein [Calothrix sp. UHCC 0171]MEA5571840.1 glycosyltransferase family 9 protein [Calothrix sp. UHCC 0171]